jgi:CDGSH-type Zn-finger protein
MPRECKCGRSETGYCQGFHNKSPEEWEEIQKITPSTA